MTQVIETDEAGDLVLSPELLMEMLGEAHPHARYVVETRGMSLRHKEKRYLSVLKRRMSSLRILNLNQALSNGKGSGELLRSR